MTDTNKGQELLSVPLEDFFDAWEKFVEELHRLGVLDLGYKHIKPELAVMNVLEPSIVEKCVEKIIEDIQDENFKWS